MDSAGHVAAELPRSAWGAPLTARSEGTPLGFQGQYHDEETGLAYNRYRHYDPSLGLFVSADPFGLAGGLHPTRYAPNRTHGLTRSAWRIFSIA